MKINLDKLRNPGTFSISMLCYLAFYYLTYRYPFQINSSTTSPTYRDTPTLLLYLKYIIFFIVIYSSYIIAMKCLISKRFSKNQIFEIFIYFYLCIIPIIFSVITKSTFVIQTGIFFSAMLLVYLYEFTNTAIIYIENITKYFLITSIIAEIIQIYMFFEFNRLPALAYYNSISVRFGSLWDDPNGFAFIISFLLPYVWHKKEYKRFFKFILILLLLLMLILTQSLTGIASSLMSFIIGSYILYLFNGKKVQLKKSIIITLIYFIGLLIAILLVFHNEYFQQFLILKKGSINEHLNVLDTIKNITILHCLGLSPTGKMHAETGYINMIFNFGLIYLFFYLLIGCTAILRLLKTLNNYNDKGVEIVYSAYFFLIAFYIGLLNLPIDTVFPINLILIICLMISHMKLIKE